MIVQIQNPDVSVRRLNIPAGESVAFGPEMHDYVLISLGSSNVAAVGYQTNFEMTIGDGEMQLLQGGWPHKLVNESRKPADLIAIESKRGLALQKPLCGVGGPGCRETHSGEAAGGTYMQTTVFETDAAKLVRLQIGPEVAMHQHLDNHDHVIVALTPLQAHADSQTFTLKRGDSFFLKGGFEELGNDSGKPATMLILELK